MRYFTRTVYHRVLLLVGLMLGMTLLFTSCVTPTNDSSNLPWNAPPSWEGQNLGVPL